MKEKNQDTDIPTPELRYFVGVTGEKIRSFTIFRESKQLVAIINFDYENDCYNLDLHDKKNQWWANDTGGSVCGSSWFAILMNVVKTSQVEEGAKNVILDFLSKTELQETRHNIKKHLQVEVLS